MNRLLLAFTVLCAASAQPGQKSVARAFALDEASLNVVLVPTAAAPSEDALQKPR